MRKRSVYSHTSSVFPAKDLRDNAGVIPRGQKEFPMYAVTGFTTTGTLYKIEYYLTVKVGWTGRTWRKQRKCPAKTQQRNNSAEEGAQEAFSEGEEY
jgi:hypothetical protein